MSADLNIILAEAETITPEILDAIGQPGLAAALKAIEALGALIAAALERNKLTLVDGVKAADAAADLAFTEKFGK